VPFVVSEAAADDGIRAVQPNLSRYITRSTLQNPTIRNATVAQTTHLTERKSFISFPNKNILKTMCVCILHIFICLGRYLVLACVRGREAERIRLESRFMKTGYSKPTEFETPVTRARDVKPKPKWHGATEEDILNIIRFQMGRGVKLQFSRPDIVTNIN